jgi:hypothetical protein
VVLPELSVAVQVTVVVPKLNTTPAKEVPVPLLTPDNAYCKDVSVQLSDAVASQAVPECV